MTKEIGWRIFAHTPGERTPTSLRLAYRRRFRRGAFISPT